MIVGKIRNANKKIEKNVFGAYKKVEQIKFDNAFYRHDIGARALMATEGK